MAVFYLNIPVYRIPCKSVYSVQTRTILALSPSALLPLSMSPGISLITGFERVFMTLEGALHLVIATVHPRILPLSEESGSWLVPRFVNAHFLGVAS